MALVFEQQQKESDKAFAPFSLYLSVGPKRSLAKTAARLVRSLVLMEKWSSKFDSPALARMRLRRTTMDSLACRRFWMEKFSFISILDMPKFLGGISWQGPAIVTLGKWTRSFLGYCGTHSFTEPDAKHELGAHDPTTS